MQQRGNERGPRPCWFASRATRFCSPAPTITTPGKPEGQHTVRIPIMQTTWTLSVMAALSLWAGQSPCAETIDTAILHDGFERVEAPETGRLAVQLTSGNAHCYPLYFYVPSITADSRYVVYHRAEGDHLQLYRLELATGKTAQLTHADSPDTRWRPWSAARYRGVLDHRSVLVPARNEVVYFDGNEARSVHVHTLKDRSLFRLPPEREPIGQNGYTPDGRRFVYIDAPRGSQYGEPCRGAKVVVYNFQTGNQKVLCTIDAAIDHVVAYDNDHFVFSHPHKATGMMMTDLESGQWVRLRHGDPGVEGSVIHFQMTARGIAYEAPPGVFAGLYDPLGRKRFEFTLPEHFGWVHTGCDPAGRLWFYENANSFTNPKMHDLWFLAALDHDAGKHRWQRLSGHWECYGKGQRAHFHPRLTPDRRWLLITAGDQRSQTNHLFLLDVADLKDTEGISTGLLSAEGKNDLIRQ